MLVSASDAATRINLLLAANAEKDMPDVFLTDMGRAQVEKYGSDGVLLPLNSYLDQYSVNYKDLFAYNDKLQKQMTAFDGNKMCIRDRNFRHPFTCAKSGRVVSAIVSSATGYHPVEGIPTHSLVHP